MRQALLAIVVFIAFTVPAQSAQINFDALSPSQAINFQRDRQDSFGYLLVFKVGDGSSDIQTDLAISNPVFGDGNVVGLLSSFAWDGGHGDPIAIQSYISVGNAQKIALLLHQQLTDTNLEFAVVIYNYDAETGEYFVALSSPLHLKGLIERDGQNLLLHTGPGTPDIQSPLTRSLVFSALPGGTVAQDINYATSDQIKVVKQWGITIDGGPPPLPTPTISWSNPADITYPAALTGQQLNAVVTGDGTHPLGAITYSPPLGTVLDAGTQTLTVNVAATGDYSAASQSVTINVLKATQTITWSDPGPITYGTALGPVQLNATAQGPLTYSPPSGTKLDAGPAQALTVTAAETTNYNQATMTVHITVSKLTPAIQWNTPAPILYGTALGNMQLNATVLTGGGVSPSGALTYSPAAGTVLDAGNGQALTVTSAETSNYNSAMATVSIDVLKASQPIQWSNPADIVYGTALGAAQLNAVAGSALTYNPPAGTILNAGQNQTLTVTAAATANFDVTTKSVSINVSKAEQSIDWNNPVAIVYGTPLGATQLNATALGALTYIPAAGTVLDAGPNQTLTVNAAATQNYNAATKSVSIDVLKASQTIQWSNPADIIYGTPLGAAQLNATAQGALTYSPAAGTILNAGQNQTLTVNAAATTNYNAASKSVSINVSKADQTIDWNNPAAIVYGTPLGAAQLNATASGALTYTPAAGTILNAGPNQTLTANAAATQNYNAATKSVSIDVLKASQTIQWSNPADIVYGTALGGAQLNAVAEGALTYTPAAGTILDAGLNQILTVTAAETANFDSATKSVSINVSKADQTITWNNPATIVYGTPLGTAQLNATAQGPLTYTPPTGTVLDAGLNQTLTVNAAATQNYNAATKSVSIDVLKASQTIQWSNPADIVYGTPLGAAQLNAVAPGALTYIPAAGTILNAGQNQTLTVSAAATANYDPATASVVINVSKATPIIVWSNPAAITYGTPLSGVQLNAVVNGGAGALTYTPPAGTLLLAGVQQTLHAAVAATDNFTNATADVKIDVNPAPLTITADDKSRTFGDDNPPLTATYSGFVNADGPGALTVPVKLQTAAVSSSPIGNYAITASDATSSNYAIHFVDGTLTIHTLASRITAAPSTVQYSDSVQLTASVTPASAGGRSQSGTVAFAIDGTPAGSSALDASGSASVSVRITRAPGSYSVTAVFTTSDNNFGGASSAPATLTVKPEDAGVVYTGTTFTSTASTIIVPLRATITDAADGEPGDLSNALVSFVDRDSGEVIASDLTVTGGSVAFDWPVTINATPSKKSDGSNGKSFTVATVVSNYYARNATVDDALVMVAEPSTHGISGGGYVIVNGSRQSFSMNATWSGNGKSIAGFMNIIARTNGRVLRFRGTPSALDGQPASGRAALIGTGTITDVTDASHPIDLGAADARFDITDRNNATNTLGISLTQTGAVVLSAGPQTIDNGGVQMH